MPFQRGKQSRREYASLSPDLRAKLQAWLEENGVAPEPEEQTLGDAATLREESFPSYADAMGFDAASKPTMAAPMPVLASMREPSTLDSYLNQLDESFREMLLRKIDELKISDAECYRKANIDRKLFNKIKNQADYRPGKSTVMALGISLQLPMDEFQELLMKAGYSLTHSSKADLIVEYFLLQENYDIFQINQALFSFDQKLLGSIS